MHDHDTRIEVYARQFEQYLTGTVEECRQARLELLEHLHDAADAGELDQALERLGSPEQAAIALAGKRPFPEAPMGDRLVAAAVDNLPLVAVSLALLIQQILTGSSFSITFPPFVYIEIGNACVAPVPIVVIGECGMYNGGLIYGLGLPLALLWSIVGVGWLEHRFATTPGKRLMGLRVVTTDGIRAPFHACLIRRLSFLAGPLAWIDWVPGLWGERQRILDKFAGTRVRGTRPEAS